MKRIPSRELLDDDAGTATEVADSLADLRFLNHCFGGVATTASMIERVAHASGKRALSLLDVAAGDGDVPITVRARLARKGIDLQPTLLDRCESHLGEFESKVVGDALAMPFEDESFDVVSCCLFVHHLNPDEVEAFTREALRCCRIAVVINDLVRHPVHFGFAHAGRLIYRSRITCNDAPASVRQSYTRKELRAMLERSRPAGIEISRHYFYRMGAIVWKDVDAMGRLSGKRRK